MTKREVLQRTLASILDHPSVYMGGPSHGSMRRAARIVDELEAGGHIDPVTYSAQYAAQRLPTDSKADFWHRMVMQSKIVFEDDELRRLFVTDVEAMTRGRA